MGEIITATEPMPRTAVWAPGDKVAVFKEVQVGFTGTVEDWCVDAAERATEGQVRPGWGDPAGYTKTIHGWGTGTVREVTEDPSTLLTYRVELDG